MQTYMPATLLTELFWLITYSRFSLYGCVTDLFYNTVSI
jgi:hypothetical protein